MSDDEKAVALLDALQRANPVPIDDAAAWIDSPAANALFAQITARPPQRVRRRTVIVAIALVVLALASLLGAFAVTDRDDDPSPAQAPLCYEKADLSSRKVVASGADLVQGCAQLWGKQGGFAGPVPVSFDRCLLPTGAVGVFPGESGSVCGRLGLRSVRTSSVAERVRAFTEAAGTAVDDHCIAYGEARDIIERKLAEFDLAGWSIGLNPDAVPYSDENPCSSIAVDDAARAVMIVPIPILRPGDSAPATAG